MEDPKKIAIADYTYALPLERIAIHPLPKRDQSKLLVWENGNIKEIIFKNISHHLPANSLLIFNDTRVIQARIRAGETPEQAARRECHEEIGQVPDTIVRMSAMHPTPGYCDEEMVFFKLSGFSVPEEKAELDEDEDIEIQVFDVKDVRDMIRRGEITDMKTVVGVALI